MLIFYCCMWKFDVKIFLFYYFKLRLKVEYCKKGKIIKIIVMRWDNIKMIQIYVNYKKDGDYWGYLLQ